MSEVKKGSARDSQPPQKTYLVSKQQQDMLIISAQSSKIRLAGLGFLLPKPSAVTQAPCAGGNKNEETHAGIKRGDI